MLKIDDLASSYDGEITFLLGNEAIARGALEAGVGFATAYPGTPSSEVGDTLAKIAKEADLYFEFSVNEKVAFEMAYAAAISKIRALTFMKVVGLNVASDSFMTAAYTGIEAGLVIMTADDPSMFSSQNEQDNRHYAEMAHIPLIEPSSPQEAKDFLISAFELSEREKIPVLFRSTTRVSHQRGMVHLGKIRSRNKEGHFERNIEKYLPFQPFSMKMKSEILDKMRRISDLDDSSDLNKVEGNPASKVGFIVSGAAYGPLVDVIQDLVLDVSVLKIGMVNPLPKKLIEGFLRSHDTVAVVEELDPFVESGVRTIAQMRGLRTRIIGKLDGIFPQSFEYTQDVIHDAIGRFIDIPEKRERRVAKIDIPGRSPVMCPGCPHRGTYYAVKRAVRMSGISNVIFPSDIGCYSLGISQPYELSDTLLSMGSSIGIAQGFSKSTKQKIIAFIGDSTFFHAGIPPLVNAVHNGSNIILIIMDNAATAMTGQQSNPGMPVDSMGNRAQEIRIEDIVRSCGVKNVSIVDPFDTRETMRSVSDALHRNELSVIITRRECAIITDHSRRKLGEIVPYAIDQSKCTQCGNCIENFACPAITYSSGKIEIDSRLCDGCGLCSEIYVCPFRAISMAVN